MRQNGNMNTSNIESPTGESEASALPRHPWEDRVENWQMLERNEFGAHEFGAHFDETHNEGEEMEYTQVMDNKFCERKE